MNTVLRYCTLVLGLLAATAMAADVPALLSGQTLYLPVYSHVYHGDPGKEGKPAQTLVSTHVSIRNTDPQTPIRLVSARYYDTQGKLVRSYLAAPVTIPPLGTHEIFVPHGCRRWLRRQLPDLLERRSAGQSAHRRSPPRRHPRSPHADVHHHRAADQGTLNSPSLKGR